MGCKSQYVEKWPAWRRYTFSECFFFQYLYCYTVQVWVFAWALLSIVFCYWDNKKGIYLQVQYYSHQHYLIYYLISHIYIYISVLPSFLGILVQDVNGIFYELILQLCTSAMMFFFCFAIQYLCMCLQKWVIFHWKGLQIINPFSLFYVHTAPFTKTIHHVWWK